MSLLVTVVVPFYNEEEVAPEFLRELREALQDADFRYEVVAVDDGSTDGTYGRLCDGAAAFTDMRVLRLARNFGHQIALRAGFEEAKGDVVVTIDGDLQDPPSVIPDLVAKHREGFDVVYAVRKKRRGEPFFRRILIRAFYRILHRISRLPVPMDAGDFRLVSRRVVEQLKAIEDPAPYWRGLVTWVGFPHATVKYDRDSRRAGRSKYGLFKLMRLAWDGITMLSHVPLRMALFLGFLVSFVSFGLGVAFIVMKMVYSFDVPGWTSLATIALFLGGVQLVTIGILGEYIGRIHEQVKRRPPYVVQDRHKNAPEV